MSVFATRRILAMMTAVLGFNLAADVVHVYEETLVDGVRTQFGDRSLATGGDYLSDEAPVRAQYIFTGWSTEANQEFASRDALGRSYDAVPFHLYELMTLTANYVPETLDSDADGMPDGYELYWYGDLSFGPDDDTDGDGYTFAEEIASGTNPLIADKRLSGVACGETALISYGEEDAMTVIIRSEPEGALFPTKVLKIEWGGRVSTEEVVGSLEGTDFYCWTMYGWEDRDSLGRARDNLEYDLWDSEVEFVALTETDPNTRAKLYWYGTANVADSSDTDGDGYTFAQEIANGTNPLVADRSISGVGSGESRLLSFCPFGYKCVFRCEPEGAFFETVTENLQAGSKVSTAGLGVGEGFCFWSVDGVEQRDSLGRARDVVTFTMPERTVEVVAKSVSDAGIAASLYWYGRDDIAGDSDSDGDGRTFAEEISSGSNPLIPDRSLTGVAIGDGATVEVNLQQYEQVVGALVEGRYEELFTSIVAGNGATSKTFGPNLTPVVLDVNDDGLFDIVLVSGDRKWTYLNVGGESNPRFVESEEGVPGWMPLDMGDPANIPVANLDVPPTDALSVTWGDADQDGITDMLVSDADGRIWYYRGLTGDARSRKYELQNKVWGGSSEGFANGLRLAAVDWDDDGDLDCLCGTAEGKLMLLRNPKVGRPTNLRASVGVDNVKLDWDPNAQSRIRGYKVYRANDSEGEGGQWNLLASPSLPTYRDCPPEIRDYGYKVSSVSRRYTAGNSTPMVSESLPTEVVRVSLGKVTLHWTDVSAKQGETFKLMLSIDNSMNLSPEGMSIELEYNDAVLHLLKTVPSGLFEDGEIAPGGGKLYEYVFEIVDENATGAAVAVKSATMFTTGGTEVVVTLPKNSAAITIAARTEVAPFMLGDVNGDGEVDDQDVRLLAQLKNAAGRKWTAEQLKAGDFNGNGLLDNADYQALRALVKERNSSKD